jgi:hypothetical protein
MVVARVCPDGSAWVGIEDGCGKSVGGMVMIKLVALGLVNFEKDVANG